jgi:hypothetical protein
MISTNPSRIIPAISKRTRRWEGRPHNLLRQASYQGQREDKPASQVVRSVPHPAAFRR